MLRLENLVSEPIQEGDVGIIITRAGEFKAFSTGAINLDNPAPGLLEQARLLQVCVLALSDESLRSKLLEVVDALNAQGFEWVNRGVVN